MSIVPQHRVFHRPTRMAETASDGLSERPDSPVGASRRHAGSDSPATTSDTAATTMTATTVWAAALTLIMAAVVVAVPVAAEAQRAADAREAGATGDDLGVFLPDDRLRERQFERSGDLLAAGRWSDAASLFDEILESQRDAFLREADDEGTRRSLKAETWKIMRGQPAAGREAYELLFGARADRRLAEAVAANDEAAIVTVARRWFHTPAGRRAAMLAAVLALEADQPAIAASWLGRLADTESSAFEPTLTVMRAVALARGGDVDAAADLLMAVRAEQQPRVGGQSLQPALSRPEAVAWLEAMAGGAGATANNQWMQPRGDAARNAMSEASRPLLVPRYRVPLTRHPEETRLLERYRRQIRDGELPPMPAGNALAIDGVILVSTNLGILAVDFESGKRLWLQTAAAGGGGGTAAGRGTLRDDASGLEDELSRAFGDATTASLAASDGLVFAVESPAEAFAASGGQAEFGLAGGGFARVIQRGRAWQGGNRLSAYDLEARGQLRWRLPRSEGGTRPATTSTTWFLGAPLVVGEELYVLAEERGEIRLDVLDARSGTVRWSQPLAELDVERVITSPSSQGRRLAGLSPALADGVLVCPLGTGTVVAIDVATRTLLWAHRYAVRADAADQGGRGPAGAGERVAADRPPTAIDSLPVIVAGRVLLAPYDSAGLVCLDLREGTPLWDEPVPGPLLVLGATADRVLVAGRVGVEARALDTGHALWTLSYESAGGRASGRGIVTRERLLVPLDTPEVIEVSIADGGLLARCPGRGGSVPGNLVAYRGEIISRGIDSLDVFHQSAALESRIETARREHPDGGWALEWEGQLDLDRGRVAAGLDKLRRAAQAPAFRMSPGTLADAVVFGLQRDFAAAAASWSDALRPELSAGGPGPAVRGAMRVAVDGFLLAGQPAKAWESLRELLRADDGGDQRLVRDPLDAAIAVDEDRWIAGRLEQLTAAADIGLREEITEFGTDLVRRAAASGPTPGGAARLAVVAERLGRNPAALRARERLLEAFTSLAGDEADSDAARRRDLERILLTSLRGAAAGDPPSVAPEVDAIWPLGLVTARRASTDRAAAVEAGRHRYLPAPARADVGDGERMLQFVFDLHEGRLAVHDELGRTRGALEIDPAVQLPGGLWMPPSGRVDAAALGRLLFIRSGESVTAFDLQSGSGRPLWSRIAPARSPRQLPGLGWGRVVGGRVARNGAVPLGMRISEPGSGLRGEPPHGSCVTAAGVLHSDGASLVLLDPLDGRVRWERHGLPPISELVGDEEFVCGCTADGTNSIVLRMADGRVVRTCTVPERRQRLGTSGRHLLAVTPAEAGPAGPRTGPVRVEAFDPVTLRREVLGTFPGDSRAEMDDAGRLLVLAPDGVLTAVAPGRGTVFATTLPEMPPHFDHLHVSCRADRLIVVAGTHAPGEVEAAATAQIVAAAGDLTPPLSGLVWAVDRANGELLWQAPVAIDRHALPLHQPAALPVVLLVRRHHDRERSRMEVVCLDARTGHALVQEEMDGGPGHVSGGFHLEGDPVAGTILLVERSTGRRTELVFTGQPVPPQPPFQAGGQRESVTGGTRPRDRLGPAADDLP
jgi:outer membrane protein assembly factor BamB